LTKFVILWCTNLAAPFPTDSKEYKSFMEHIWASIDKRVKEGMLKDYGFFLESKAGYAIAETTAEQVFKFVSMFAPYWTFTIHEVMPYEKGKDILRRVMTGAIECAEAAKKI
jgi:L-rhamnose mutarotase